jgi:tetratricopeptide (TPR) repeat protein
MKTWLPRAVITTLAGLALATLAVAQNAEKPKDDAPKNLQVLPKTWTRDQVIPVMKAFSGALGVRCQHCHVAKDPADFKTFDFASDEKETKKVARAMMRMTSEINDRLLPQTGRTDLVKVQCITCHRGVPEPEQLVDILTDVADKEGVDAAEQRYQDLRQKYYGSASYDFSRATLGALATRRADKGDLAGAIQLQEFSIAQFPGVAASHAQLADLYLKKGDRDAARAQMEKAAAIDPSDPSYQRRLKELQAPPQK